MGLLIQAGIKVNSYGIAIQGTSSWRTITGSGKILSIYMKLIIHVHSCTRHLDIQFYIIYLLIYWFGQ